MSDPTKPTPTTKTTPEQLKILQQGISSLIAYVRSREMSENIRERTFNEVLQAHIFSLVGDDQDALSIVEENLIEGQPETLAVRKIKLYGRQVLTRKDRVEKLLAQKDAIIAAVKRIDPSDIATIREE